MAHSDLARMPFDGTDVPHVVIEVNQKCDISCAACYKDKFDYTKSLQQIKDEIDFAASQRRLSAISLMGGEPTLHPDLPEIIAYVKGKGIAPQILSNGYALTAEKLAAYRKAGLQEVFLHVDSMQRRDDAGGEPSERALNALRARIARRIVDAGLVCSLALTVYAKTLDQLPDVVDFVLQSPDVTRLLVTCYTDFDAIAKRLRRAEVLGRVYERERTGDEAPTDSVAKVNGQVVSNGEVKVLLDRTLGMRPFAYVRSNLRESSERWIMYNSMVVTDASGESRFLHFGPTFGRVMSMMDDLRKRRGEPHPFINVPTSADCVKACLFYAATSLDPGVMLETARFLAALARPGARIASKHMVFQQGPRLNEEGELEYCKDCPDATVRNGRLVPVCLSDILAALPAEDVRAAAAL
jgi:molybdenum cofactor biosynthesis enzyme MoaA